MGKIYLSETDRKKLRLLQKKTRNIRVSNRIAVILGLDLGLDYRVISKMLSLDDSTIRRYEEDFLANDLTTYLEDDYSAYWGKLDSSCLGKLSRELDENLYQTSVEVMDYIQREFGVRYTQQGVVKLLNRLGFSYKKPKLIPSKANREAQEEFIEKVTRLRDGLKEDEILYYGDAVHPQHNTRLACGWIRRGREKEIKSNTGRTRVNINGVLNPETKEVIVREDKTINAQSTIELYKDIESRNPNMARIYIVNDNARYYKNKVLNEYLETSRIEQVFLPAYSPNLNLIERLWKFMHKKVINNQYYEKSTEFKEKIMDFFENIGDYKDELDSLMTFKFELFNSS